MLFDFLNDITFLKKDLTRQGDDSVIKSYEPFPVIQGLSQHVDTVLIANELNKHPMVTKQMHHDYLFHSIRSKKRMGKWAKKTKIDKLNIIVEYYQCSKEKAKDYLKILTDEQVKQIETILYTGGKIK